jgi:uncharacterized protein
MSLTHKRSRRAQDGKPSLLFHPHERPPGTWPVCATELFRERLLDADDLFPCIFGIDALRKGSLRFAFIPVGESRVGMLADSMLEFTEIAAGLGQRTSLVCLFEHDPRIKSLEQYRDHFWWLLTQLHEADTGKWPDDISPDPDDPTWEFSYNSMPMFVVASTPYHVKRRSRYFEYFTVTFQPRFVFHNLQAGMSAGDHARKVIRRRLADYDLVARTPLLGSFGAPGNKEWQQYFLDDDNVSTDLSAGCPFTTHPHLPPVSTDGR